MTKIKMNTDFLDLAYKFWKLSENAIEIMGKTGNKDIVFTDGSTPQSLSWSDAEETFKWNANSIGIPVLFNFYHGLELFMKGFMDNDRILCEKSHTLTSLYKDLRTSNSAPESVLYVLKKILFSKNNKLHQFFKDNDEKNGIDSFYLSLKYPIQNNAEVVKSKVIRENGYESYEAVFKLVKSYIHELYNSLLEYNCNDSNIVDLLKK